MKRQVRRNVFETNSSSVHTIAIGKQAWNKLPEKLDFHVGEFGWEWDMYEDMNSRASYLFTAIHQLYQDNWSEDEKEDLSPDYKDWTDYITETLDGYGVEAVFHAPHKSDFYYIDHASSLMEWLKRIRESEELLMMFLFSPESVIMTGNDNDECFPCNLRDLDEDSYLDYEEKYN